jgi:cell division protein FtsL
MNKLNKRLEHHPHRQQGLTGIAMALILAMVAFFAMVAIRLFPVYMEHFSVSSHLKSLSEEVGIKGKTNKEILDTLNKRFAIDDVSHVTQEDIFIERAKDGTITVAIEYEVRTPALGNIDMVVSFVDEVVLD